MLFNLQATECISCLSCNNTSDPGQCVHVEQCPADHSCKMLECVKDGANSDSGANAASVCSECCYDNNCNVEGCGYQIKSRSTQCYDCTNVYKGGPPCNNTVFCDFSTNTCSVSLHRHSIHRNAFDLGCTNKRQCELLLSLPGESKDPDAKCCGKFLCNGDPHINPPVSAYTCPPNIASCETCLSGNCTNPRTMPCGHGEQYCMNKVISDGVTTTVKKACATQMECYYESYIGMKNKPECAGASGNAWNQSYVCHYCCDAKSGHLSACNTDIIPQQRAVFDQPGSQSSTVCEVGLGKNVQETICNSSKPFCMNSIIPQINHIMILKTCESAITCKVGWWDHTRNRKVCLQTSASMLPILNADLVCHYCCRYDDGQPCNTELIPSDAQNVIAKSVDGGWSEWTAWTGCSQYCTGIQDRHRRCDNPVPGVYGTNCHGLAFEQENCDPNNNCKISVDGGWSKWTAWTGCSQYCTGIQDRHRRCDNPVPGVGGTNCQGQAYEQENCDSNTNCKISAPGSQTLIGR